MSTTRNTEGQEKQAKTRTVFLLGQREREALEQMSTESGAPLSELLRRATANFIEKQRARA